ncbi:MAG: hypothetical protein WDN46_14250 [Methylocella sp.]
MSRETFVFRDGKMVRKEDAEPLDGGFHLIRDGMEPLRHMADGRVYDSKSAFRHATKAAGCCEVGDHVFKPRAPIKLDRRERVDAIKKTIYDIRNGKRA